jgi:DNA mismatch endonuclease (patch repair protein)
MADKISKEHRSWNMSRVKSKNTRPELMIRSILHKQGYRFRLNRKDLPGKPDIVLPKHQKIIFVHGCFWHQHSGCSASKRPSTNVEFWDEKLDSNIKRDRYNQESLRKLGWDICVIWECETRKKDVLVKKLKGFL